MYAIDFGTSNSLLAASSPEANLGLAKLDPAASDPSVLRSLIYFEEKSVQHFGETAIKRFTDNSLQGRFLRSFKRFLPVKSFEGTQIDGRFWKLEDLVARFLREMRERGNAHFQSDVTSVVLGRPALFSEDSASDSLAQSRLEAAARLAGFKHIEFLAEPVAAAYRYRLEMKKEEIVLVADFGGGTSDYTLLKLSPRAFTPSDVLAIGGVPLAGDSIDGLIMQHRVAKNFGSEVRYRLVNGNNVLQMPKGLMAHLCSTAYINLLNSRENRAFLNQVKLSSLGADDARAIDQLEILLESQLGFSVFESIEKAKKDVSLKGQGDVDYRYPGVDIHEALSEAQLADYTHANIEKIFSGLDETLQKAGLRAEQVDRVCCTGGTARLSLIRSELSRRFGQERLENFRNLTSIVEGLGERAQQLLKAS